MKTPRQVVTSVQLLNDFQSTFVSGATTEAAAHEAQRSEDDLLNHLQSVSGNRYLDAGTLAPEKELLTRASLDAHIKKVQAEQLTRMNAAQVSVLQAEAQARYVGRSITLAVTESTVSPIEAVVFDQRTGWRNIVSRRKSLTGTIEHVLLDKNALVIRPAAMTRFFNSNVHNYVVYIINPNTFTPMVEVNFV